MRSPLGILDIGSNSVRLHTSVCAFTITVGTDHTLIFTAAHFSVFGTSGFHRHIAAVTLADKIFESYVNSACVAFIVLRVKIVADRNKPRMIQWKYTLNEKSRLNAVSPKTRKVFDNNTIYFSRLYQRQKLLNSRTFKIHTCVSVINKLH